MEIFNWKRNKYATKINDNEYEISIIWEEDDVTTTTGIINNNGNLMMFNHEYIKQ